MQSTERTEASMGIKSIRTLLANIGMVTVSGGKGGGGRGPGQQETTLFQLAKQPASQGGKFFAVNSAVSAMRVQC